jgi:hypothetical protein
MADSILYIFTTLKQDPAIKPQPGLCQILSDIEKYSDNKITKVYLLGYFFKHKLDSDKLSPENKNLLISEIKKDNLEDYFYLREDPGETRSTVLMYIDLVFMTLGLFMIGGGIYGLNTGSFSFLINTKYQTPVFREGGYYLVFGLILFIGGVLHYRFQRRKNRFIRSFIL